MLHYSQKRRYYFFITIVKFKTVLSYYPPAGASFPPTAYPSLNLRSTFAQPSLNLRSTFAQPSLNLRSTFAQPSLNLRSTFAYDCATLAPHLRHTCATHFGKLSEFAKVNQLPRWRKFPLAGASLQLVPNSPQCLSFVTYSAVPAR